MKKSFMMLLAVLLVLPVFGTNVFAEEADEIVYEDGVHEGVPIEVTYNGTVFDEFSETATVTIEDGNQYIQLTHTGMEAILEITIPEGEVDILNEDVEEDVRSFGFNYEGDLNELIPFNIHMFYGQTHNMSLILNTSDIPVVEPSDPEEPEEEQEQEQPETPAENEQDLPEEQLEEEPVEEEDQENQNDNPDLNPNEAFEIPYTSELDLARYFDESATLLYKDERMFLQLVGGMGQFVDALLINGQEMTLSEVNEDGSYIAQFEVTDRINETFSFTMDLTTPMGPSEHITKITFNDAEKQAVDSRNYFLLPIPEEIPQEPEIPEEEPVEPEQPEEEPVQAPKDEGSISEDVEGDTFSKINYQFMHATNNEVSAANSFFTDTALIVERDGEKFVRITSNAPHFIDSLVAVFGNDRITLELVENNGEFGVYEFKLPADYNLSEEIQVEMKITVPGAYEGRVHDTRLVFDVESLEEIGSEEEMPDPQNDNNNPGNNSVDNTGGNTNDDDQNTLDSKTPEKPELGGEMNEDEEAGSEIQKNVLNPQTGENTNILLYVLLLLGSAIPLAIQVRKRFV